MKKGRTKTVDLRGKPLTAETIDAAAKYVMENAGRHVQPIPVTPKEVYERPEPKNRKKKAKREMVGQLAPVRIGQAVRVVTESHLQVRQAIRGWLEDIDEGAALVWAGGELVCCLGVVSVTPAYEPEQRLFFDHVDVGKLRVYSSRDGEKVYRYDDLREVAGQSVEVHRELAQTNRTASN